MPKRRRTHGASQQTYDQTARRRRRHGGGFRDAGTGGRRCRRARPPRRIATPPMPATSPRPAAGRRRRRGPAAPTSSRWAASTGRRPCRWSSTPIASSAAAEPIPGSDEEHHDEAAESNAGGESRPAHAEHGAGEDNITEINGAGGEEEAVESVGGADAMEEVPERMSRMRRQYKIQEVIKRRQVMLVQVVKEERGTKGAALTTYLSLAGRYSVLMPNTARGGGISRKITDSVDRKRLKEVAQELEVPEGMGVILRTAGASRTKTEIKRDFEYLLRLWETVRDLTLEIDGADAGLRGRLAGQALDPRSLQQGHRRNPGRRRRRLPGCARFHAHADAEPRQEREALSRERADVRPLRDREPARRHVPAGGAAALRRLHRDQPGRGAGRHRRQFGPRHPRAPHRGHRAQDQSRGRRGGRPAAAPARSRRADRHRLHRHGREAQQSHGRAPA